jgi:hypothetical protein
VRDALRKAFGIVVGSLIRDPIRVEHDEVRSVSGRDETRLPNLNRRAGKDVIFLIASSRVSSFLSRTYLARTCGKVP